MYLVDENVWNRPAKSKKLTDKGYTPLHWAARFGHDAIVKVILNVTGAAMPRTGTGNTPLHLSAKYGHFNVTKTLLDSIDDDSDINPHAYKGDGDFLTPLHEAAAGQHPRIVELIMNRHRASA